MKKLLGNDHLGAKTWPCYNQNRVITSSVIKGLKCIMFIDGYLFCLVDTAPVSAALYQETVISLTQI